MTHILSYECFSLLLKELIFDFHLPCLITEYVNERVNTIKKVRNLRLYNMCVETFPRSLSIYNNSFHVFVHNLSKSSFFKKVLTL